MVPSSAPVRAAALCPIFFQTHPMLHDAPHVQCSMATASWIDHLSASRLDVVDVVDVDVNTTMLIAHLTPIRRRRRQWDPGIVSTMMSPSTAAACYDGINGNSTSLLTFALRLNVVGVVDDTMVPLIRPPAPLHPSIGSMSPTLILLTVTSIATDNNTSFYGHNGKTPSVGFDVNTSRRWSLSLRPTTVDGAACDPFLLRPTRPTRPMVSMFQHCHPVLSRPTVPNII